MAATVSSEHGALKSLKDGLELEPLDAVFLHEKTQKLFKYARAKDKHEELKKDLLNIAGKQRRELCQREDERHNTALHYAAKAGNLETCKFLVEQGADIKALGQNKMSPLQFAARYGDENKGKDCEGADHNHQPTLDHRTSGKVVFLRGVFFWIGGGGGRCRG